MPLYKALYGILLTTTQGIVMILCLILTHLITYYSDYSLYIHKFRFRYIFIYCYS